MSNVTSRLAPRLSLNLNLQTKLMENINIEPSILLMRQNNYQEFEIGANLIISFKQLTASNSLFPNSFIIGLFTRESDALNVLAGLETRNWKLVLSYDINYSALDKVSYNKGAFEISLIYKIFKNYKPNLSKPPCRIM